MFGSAYSLDCFGTKAVVYCYFPFNLYVNVLGGVRKPFVDYFPCVIELTGLAFPHGFVGLSWGCEPEFEDTKRCDNGKGPVIAYDCEFFGIEFNISTGSGLVSALL